MHAWLYWQHELRNLPGGLVQDRLGVCAVLIVSSWHILYNCRGFQRVYVSMGSKIVRIDSQLAGGSNSLYLFGGRDALGNNLRDFWNLDLATWTWTRVVENFTFPVARRLHTLASDDEGNLFLFGGMSDFGKLNDLWRWNVKTQHVFNGEHWV